MDRGGDPLDERRGTGGTSAAQLDAGCRRGRALRPAPARRRRDRPPGCSPRRRRAAPAVALGDRRLDPAIASARSSTPEMAKKHVCSTVLIRPPNPASRAIRPASMTYSSIFLARICSWMGRASTSQTSAAGCGAVEQQRRPGRGAAQDLGVLEQPELVAADEARLVDQVRRADRLVARSAGGTRSGTPTSSSRRRSSPGRTDASSEPRILIVFLLAPTVPSDPRPKKTARSVSGGSMSNDGR